MSEAHENTRIRQLEDAAAHWEHKYVNARQYNRNLEERNQKLEAELADMAARYRAAHRLSELNIEGRNDPLMARIHALEAAVRPLAGIPIEAFGLEKKKDYPLHGWNGYTIHSGHVIDARKALATAETSAQREVKP